jgi:hypothetical protein
MSAVLYLPVDCYAAALSCSTVISLFRCLGSGPSILNNVIYVYS